MRPERDEIRARIEAGARRTRERVLGGQLGAPSLAGVHERSAVWFQEYLDQRSNLLELLPEPVNPTREVFPAAKLTPRRLLLVAGMVSHLRHGLVEMVLHGVRLLAGSYVRKPVSSKWERLMLALGGLEEGRREVELFLSEPMEGTTPLVLFAAPCQKLKNSFANLELVARTDAKSPEQRIQAAGRLADACGEVVASLEEFAAMLEGERSDLDAFVTEALSLAEPLLKEARVVVHWIPARRPARLFLRDTAIRSMLAELFRNAAHHGSGQVLRVEWGPRISGEGLPGIELRLLRVPAGGGAPAAPGSGRTGSGAASSPRWPA